MIASTHRAGWSESLVAAELLRRGIEVFRPINGCAPCDLVALFEQGLRRVEVKYAARSDTKRRRAWNIGVPRPGQYDVLAVVFESGEIAWFPPLDEGIPRYRWNGHSTIYDVDDDDPEEFPRIVGETA